MALSSNQLEALKAFHGHLGPYLVLGSFAVEHGCALLGVAADDVNAVVECNLQSPQRCLADAIQFCSHATFGRGRLAVLTGPRARVRLIEPRSGSSVVLTLSPFALELLGKLPPYDGPGSRSDEDIENLARELAAANGDECWSASHHKLPPTD